ncbi:acyltransferase family protein [Actinomadura alba]|uniref:Acyltransferase family protein n=1 Tax=Actinomadura alba TaxID=406431 RepID=A0ABR7LNZ8_9ACTN|nr:acyltransferase family protein [Actinomadura alba]MBC6466481.1 acyltransferase family protein [Actinomadura alba]
MARYAAVDGLRGIAILSVLLYHTNWFRNGLFGVDAFFVLSGFLTTLLLIREVERNGRIRVAAFYRRRFKRLMPGLMITLGLVVAVAYVTSPLKEARSISDQALGSVLQVANWAQIARGDSYWDHFGTISPLSAMWSLSITEQFYVVWPLVLVVAFALFRRAVLPVAVLTVLLFAGSAGVAPYLWNGSNSDFLYLATHTRAVAFMAGAAAAFVVYLAQRRTARRGRQPSGAVTALLTVVGLSSFVGIVFFSVKVSTYHDAWLYQGGLALVALLIGVLTASLCIERGPLVKALSLKPLMEIGQISYTIYLLHLPVYWLLLMAWPDLRPWALFILGTGLTWLTSMVMHYSIEQVRVREWRASRAIPLFTTVALVVGFSAYYLPAYVADSMRPDGKPLVLTLGDSMAEDFSTALSKHGDGFAVADGGQGGCGVMSPDKVRDKVNKVLVNWDACRRWETFWKDQLENSGPDAVLIHVGWDAAEQNIRGTWLTPCHPAYRTRYLKQLATAVDLVREEAPQAKILLMNERRENGAINADWGICFNKVVGQYVAKATPNVHLVDLDAFLCPHGKCLQYTPTGQRLYPDGDGVHLTNAGMGYVEPWLKKQISAALAGTAPKK